MADILTMQDLANGHLDVKALGEAANGDENTIVTTRTGNTYPSAERAIKTLFENGGLPATPFATKALMTASALVDDKYALVTDDAANNGLYVKTAGVWVKSAYDPLTQAKSYTDTNKADTLLRVQNVFATKALMTESALVDGSNAQVNNDTTADNNGFYKKTAGTWVKSTYDPVALAASDATTKANNAKTQAVAESKTYTDTKATKDIIVSDVKASADATGELITGEFWSSTGNLVAHSSAKRTKKIALNSLDSYWVTRSVGALTDMRTVFFDVNEVFISAFGHAEGVETKLVIPTNAKFVAVSGLLSQPLTVVRKNTLDGVALIALQADMKNLPNDVREVPIVLSIDARYLDSATGGYLVNNSFKASDKISVVGYSALLMNGTLNTDIGGQVLFYDNTGALVPSTFVKKASYTDYTLPIPVGAVSVAVSTSKITDINVKIQGKIINGFNDINSTYAQVKADVKSNAKSLRANSLYSLGANYPAVKEQRSIDSYGLLFAGQSNMKGEAEYAELAGLSLPTTLDVKNWTGTSFTTSKTIATNGRWGVWWSLLKRLRDYKPTKELYYYLNAADGTSMAVGWNAVKAGTNFDSFMSNIATIKQQGVVNFKAVVWWQGESDKSDTYNVFYEQRLKDFINATRGAVGDPIIPFIIVGTHKDVAIWYSKVVRDAQLSAANDLTNVYFINTDDITYTSVSAQNGHYNGVFFEAVAPRIFSIIKDL